MIRIKKSTLFIIIYLQKCWATTKKGLTHKTMRFLKYNNKKNLKSKMKKYNYRFADMDVLLILFGLSHLADNVSF
jgi:hypothetical protein